MIAPVVGEMLRPIGRFGKTLYARGAVPPEPVTGVNDAVASFCVRTFEATAWVAVTPLFTVRLNMDVAVAPFVSVTVTVKLVVESTTPGVPLIVPVVGEILRPVGKPGETL